MTAAVSQPRTGQPGDEEDRERQREQDKVEVADEGHDLSLIRRFRGTLADGGEQGL